MAGVSRKKFSTILDESLIKSVKLYSVLLDRAMSEIIEDALREYIEKLEREKKVSEFKMD